MLHLWASNLYYQTCWDSDQVTMALIFNSDHTKCYNMDALQSMGLAHAYFTHSEYLVVKCWVHNTHISPNTINKMGPWSYCYVKFFMGRMGYTPLGSHAIPLLPLIAYGEWSCILPWQNSNGGISLGHVVVFQGPPIQYCCSTAWHLIGFCWQKQLGKELYCLVHYHSQIHPLPALIQFQGQHLMHQFPGIGVWMHHEIQCMCLSSLCSWPYHINLGTIWSLSRKPSLMSILQWFTDITSCWWKLT